MHPKSFLSNFWGALQKVFGTLVFVVRHVVYFDTSHISTPFPVTSAFETVMDFPV